MFKGYICTKLIPIMYCFNFMTISLGAHLYLTLKLKIMAECATAFSCLIFQVNLSQTSTILTVNTSGSVGGSATGEDFY